MNDRDLYREAKSAITNSMIQISAASNIINTYDSNRTAEQYLDKAIEEAKKAKGYIRRFGEENG